MKMTFPKLFHICMFKDPKLAEKWTDLAENPKKKGELRGVHGVRFAPHPVLTLYPCKNPFYICYYL